MSLPTPEPTTPAPTAENTIAVTYLGCYADNGSRAFNKRVGTFTMEDCALAALDEGSSKFGMQYPQGGSGETAGCWIHDKGVMAETAAFAKRTDRECKGESWNPTFRGDVFEYNGNGWRNAVYHVRDMSLPTPEPTTPCPNSGASAA